MPGLTLNMWGGRDEEHKEEKPKKIEENMRNAAQKHKTMV